MYALAGAGLRLIVGHLRGNFESCRDGGACCWPPQRWSRPWHTTLVTNIYTGIVWAQMTGGFEYKRWILTALFNPGALLFGAYHVGSNVVFLRRCSGPP